MKALAFASLIGLVSTAALAGMPNLGDEAMFDMTVTQGSISLDGTFELKLTAFDQATSEFTATESISLAGQVQTQDTKLAKDDMLTEEKVTQILSMCPALGGVAEKITVPAGDFDTCALPSEQGDSKGTLWLGQVIFGVVKQDLTDSKGQRTVVVLRSMKAGQ